MELNGIVFDKILSTETTYGIIWSGTYNKKPCAIKILVLTSGVHYDRANKDYRDGNNKKITSPKCFDINEEIPFLNKDYKKKKALPSEEFLKEASILQNLSTLGLTPNVYKFGIIQREKIHYGFIVMDRVDLSLKSLLMRRSLTAAENEMVKNRVDELHHIHGLIHGDLKPSNIGVFLDYSGKIERLVFFDCGKVKYLDKMRLQHFLTNEMIQLKESEFLRLVADDQDTYRRHISKNRKAAKGLSKKGKH